MLTHTPSRAKLPFLIAAWMLVAIIALIGSGLTGTTQAQGTSGVIPSINLDSNEAGQLIITWATPEQAPTDYRIRDGPTPTSDSLPTAPPTNQNGATNIRSPASPRSRSIT